jgi:Phosphotransferase enzyme family
MAGAEGCRYRVIWGSAQRGEILASAAGDALPEWHVAKAPWWQLVDGVNASAAACAGATPVTLRCLRNTYDEKTDYYARWYEVETVDGTPGGSWYGPELAARLRDDDDASLVAGWFRERACGVPADRTFYARNGWYQDVLPWLRAASGGTVTQLRTWERGCTLRMDDGGAFVYAKLLPPVFAHEPQVTALLAKRFANHVPSVLTLSESFPAMLTADIGGRLLSECRRVEPYLTAVRTYAAMQRSIADRSQEFIGAGCPRRTPADALMELPSLLAALASYPGFEPGDAQRIRSREVPIRRTLEDLCESRFPCSLDHGDFTSYNVMVRGSEPVIFDWSDAIVTHPFAGLANFLQHEAPPVVRAHSDRIAAAYLSTWDGHGSDAARRAEFERIEHIAPVLRALKYHVDLLPRMEQEARWQHHWSVAASLRSLIERDE